jgi:hypothetical protein
MMPEGTSPLRYMSSWHQLRHIYLEILIYFLRKVNAFIWFSLAAKSTKETSNQTMIPYYNLLPGAVLTVILLSDILCFI